MEYRKNKKIDRRVLYTKMFLRESLLALMKEKPIARITASELCRHADINRNTFYTHYDNPEALLKSIEDELYEQVKHSIERSLKNGSIPTLLTEIFQAIYDNRDLCTILFSEYGDKDFLRHIIDLSHDRTIAEWRAAGMKDNEEQIEMIYQFSVNGSVAIIQKWIQEGQQKKPRELALFLSKISYFGLQAFLNPVDKQKSQ